MSRFGAALRPPAHVVLTGVLVVAALAAGRAVEALTPDDHAGFGRPFLRPVAMGETVGLRYADLTPVRVDGAPVLDRGVLAPKQSPGLWVVTTVSVTPRLDTQTLGSASLLDGRGRELQLGIRNERLCAATVPGVATACVIAFEVPVDAAAGSHLRLARSPQETRGDDMADVDLGITPEAARAWKARTDRVTAEVPGLLDAATGTRGEDPS